MEEVDQKDPVFQMVVKAMDELSEDVKRGAEVREMLREVQRLEHRAYSDHQWLIAVFQILKENNIKPSSKELVEAYKRSQEDGVYY